MSNPVKRPVLMICAGALLIVAACLLPLIKDHRWDNLIYGATFGIGILVVLMLFTTAIQRTKA